eukprot:CAMPEP_0202918268 /NCGR_PEP_ID=MMETSP1392-20130828/73025_1 /ASSEMBLY_ACC=CAM_ASM_000868 /TAXON_ID=225041 /ORGANISM="Chlamydomonas chlamydogama, Strain SAG 11-48b" /LENGTH=388 /DNA_ID=CAMNT_0049611269 /DNA_START=89 /DNA_END=1252 /DNA_ORIENTATION=-
MRACRPVLWACLSLALIAVARALPVAKLGEEVYCLPDDEKCCQASGGVMSLSVTLKQERATSNDMQPPTAVLDLSALLYVVPHSCSEDGTTVHLSAELTSCNEQSSKLPEATKSLSATSSLWGELKGQGCVASSNEYETASAEVAASKATFVRSPDGSIDLEKVVITVGGLAVDPATTHSLGAKLLRLAIKQFSVSTAELDSAADETVDLVQKNDPTGELAKYKERTVVSSSGESDAIVYRVIKSDSLTNLPVEKHSEVMSTLVSTIIKAVNAVHMMQNKKPVGKGIIHTQLSDMRVNAHAVVLKREQDEVLDLPHTCPKTGKPMIVRLRSHVQLAEPGQDALELRLAQSHSSRHRLQAVGTYPPAAPPDAPTYGTYPSPPAMFSSPP